MLLLIIDVCHIYNLPWLDELPLSRCCSVLRDVIRGVLWHECLFDTSSLGMLAILVHLWVTVAELLIVISVQIFWHFAVIVRLK